MHFLCYSQFQLLIERLRNMSQSYDQKQNTSHMQEGHIQEWQWEEHRKSQIFSHKMI